ncbi:hypothetical protein JK358_32305 [Nocardia sp. 2]|uniref:Asp23/Gls24 family envelope stress response protein n=1 Tax=Nocardia acididurans TaxID=2802282 RepID=A0ABS1MEQ3_9NOCA|nr:hypothetical protein [Nocardia acididurans]MBL1079097.1 hypothetical protein [Nocardia acididurans]
MAETPDPQQPPRRRSRTDKVIDTVDTGVLAADVVTGIPAVIRMLGGGLRALGDLF